MNWTSLQKLIPSTAGKYNMAPTLTAVHICQEYRTLAPTMLPEEILKNSSALSYKNQTLTIAVKNSAWAEKIQLCKHRLQQAINKKFGENTIKKIIIQLIEEEEEAIQIPDSLDSTKPSAIN